VDTVNRKNKKGGKERGEEESPRPKTDRETTGPAPKVRKTSQQEGRRGPADTALGHRRGIPAGNEKSSHRGLIKKGSKADNNRPARGKKDPSASRDTVDIDRQGNKVKQRRRKTRYRLNKKNRAREGGCGKKRNVSEGPDKKPG